MGNDTDVAVFQQAVVALQVATAHVGGLKVEQRAGDPEAAAAPLVGDQVELPPPAGVSLMGDPDALDLIRRDGGEVDIQECTLGDASPEIVVQDGAQVVGDRGEVGILVVAIQRQGDGRYAVVGSLDGRPDRARIGRRRSGVGAVVDARNDQIRHNSVLLQDPHAHLHAIHRRAGKAEEAEARLVRKLLQVKVLEEPQRSGFAGLRGGGGYNGDFAVGTHGIHDDAEALGLVAVVVGDENMEAALFHVAKIGNPRIIATFASISNCINRTNFLITL